MPPPPIFNFEILNLQGEYCQKFSQVFNIDKSQWCNHFNDWENMSLKFGIEPDTDFYLVTHQNWLRLVNAYGGGPEIPIYQYVEDRMAAFGQSERFVGHDLDPIKVELHSMSMTLNGEFQFHHKHTVLVSRHISQTQLKQAFVEALPHIYLNKFKMFVIRPTKTALTVEDEMHPNIFKAPADKQRLFDLGIQDGQVVVFLSLEE